MEISAGSGPALSIGNDVSTVKYPSFKSLGLRSSSTFEKAIVAALFLAHTGLPRQDSVLCPPSFVHRLSPVRIYSPADLGQSAPRNRRRRMMRNRPGVGRLNGMADIHPILLAGLTGFISGFLLSIPVGPINLTIMNEARDEGFFWAMMIGLGATTMEMIYCFIAFTGFASFFARGYVQSSDGVVQLVFMLFLGVKFLLAKSVVQAPVHFGPLPINSRSVWKSAFTPAPHS